MKKSVGSKETRWRAIAEIISKYGTTSPSEIQEHLEKEYGIKTSRKTIWQDLKNDIDKLSDDDLKDTKASMLRDLDSLIQIAFNRAKGGGNDSLKAMETYNRLIKTKAEIVAKFEELKSAFEIRTRPIYEVQIGHPDVATKGDKKNG